MENLFGRRSIWRPPLTEIYSGLTPSARGYDTVSTSSLYDPTRLKTDSGVLFLCWLFVGAGLIDGQASILVCSFEQPLSHSSLQVLRFILCITVIWRVWDNLVSDPAKQVLERHEKRDRREDGAAVWTNEMAFRQQTDWKVRAYRIWNIFAIDPTLNLTILWQTERLAHIRSRGIPKLTQKRRKITWIYG